MPQDPNDSYMNDFLELCGMTAVTLRDVANELATDGFVRTAEDGKVYIHPKVNAAIALLLSIRRHANDLGIAEYIPEEERKRRAELAKRLFGHVRKPQEQD